MMNRDKLIGIVCVLLSAVCFSLAGVLIKFCSWSSLSLNGGRSAFAFFVVLISMLISGHKFKFNFAVLFGGLANTAMSLTFTIANKNTTAANAIVLQFIMPAFLILILWIFWNKKPDMLSIGTVVASFSGIVFFFIDSLGGGSIFGDIIAIVSGLFYAIVFVIKKIPGADFESAFLVSCVINLIIGLPSIIAEPDRSLTNMICIVALGVVQMGMAYVFLNIGLDKVAPVAASLISMIEPILNPVLVAIFYGETMGFMSFIGAVIVLGSAAFYNVMSLKRVEKVNG